MKYYLYQFNDNWDDEMDVQGFAVLTEAQKDMALAHIKREYKRGGVISFGSNEENYYKSLRDVMSCVSFKEISLVQYNAIRDAFDDYYFGELGPLDICEIDDEVQTCSNCGDDLEYGDGDEYEFCESCKREIEEDEMSEQEYDRAADQISEFIMSEYGLEKTSSNQHHSRFVWKPTPKTEIDITISEHDGSEEEEIELTLKKGNKKMEYDCLFVCDIADNPGYHLKSVIKNMIDKAKRY